MYEHRSHLERSSSAGGLERLLLADSMGTPDFAWVVALVKKKPPVWTILDLRTAAETGVLRLHTTCRLLQAPAGWSVRCVFHTLPP